MIDMKLIDELRRYAEQYQKPPTGREIDGTAELLIAAADALEKAQPQWIPVTERLPEDGTYICTLDGELVGQHEPFTSMCGIENGVWDEQDCVLAWMPLPEPYEPAEEE